MKYEDSTLTRCLENKERNKSGKAEHRYFSFFAQLFNYLQSRKKNRIQQRFSTGVSRKFRRCAAGVWGNVEKKREKN
jgi:hypothetical protein